MTDFCICRAIVSLLSPTSSLRAFLTSLEYPPSTSTIILNCFTRYSGYLCSSSQRNGPYFVVFSASFSSLFSNPRAAHLYHRYFLILLVHDGSVDPIRLYVRVICIQGNVPICYRPLIFIHRLRLDLRKPRNL